MSGNELTAFFSMHGGVREVHTEPVRDEGTGRLVGWRNRAVCADGVEYALTPQEEAAYLSMQDN